MCSLFFFKVASFICLQQRIISSLYCFTCAGFQRWKQTKVSLSRLLFYRGGGIYARTTVKPPKIKAAATVQITDEGTNLSIIACEYLSFCQSSHLPLLVSKLLFLMTCSRHFLSMKGCLAFKKIFLHLAFAVLLYKR